MGAVKKLPGLNFPALVAVQVATLVADLVADLVAVLVLVLVNPINQSELTDYVHIHDPSHNSVLIHVISCYLHSFIVVVLVFYYALKYYVDAT